MKLPRLPDRAWSLFWYALFFLFAFLLVGDVAQVVALRRDDDAIAAFRLGLELVFHLSMFLLAIVVVMRPRTRP